MARRSDEKLLIDRVLARGPAMLLKQGGFRKDDWTFWREVGPFVHILRVQEGRENGPNPICFTFYLSVAIPAFHPFLTQTEIPKKPAKAISFDLQSLTHRMPEGRDNWWRVGPNIDFAALGGDVALAIEEWGMPYFDSFHDLEDVARRYDSLSEERGVQPWYADVNRALLQWAIGRREQARSMLEAQQAELPIRGNLTVHSMIERMIDRMKASGD